MQCLEAFLRVLPRVVGPVAVGGFALLLILALLERLGAILPAALEVLLAVAFVVGLSMLLRSVDGRRRRHAEREVSRRATRRLARDVAPRARRRARTDPELPLR